MEFDMVTNAETTLITAPGTSSRRTSVLMLTGCIVLLLLSSCRQQEETAVVQEPPDDMGPSGPSRELQITVQNLVVLGFVPSAKIEEQDYHYHDHLIAIQNQPFFIVDAKQHWFLGRSEFFSETLEQGNLGKVVNVWAYIVRSENTGATVPDAIIEEWQYETQQEAFDAFKEMGNVLDSRYIKEPSYTIQHDTSIYLLYTRAHAFQKDLDRIYEMLKSHL